MFRFEIRDVLWLMVVVAMGVAWWTDRKIQEAHRAAGWAEALTYIDKLESAAIDAGFLFTTSKKGLSMQPMDRRPFPPPPP